MSKLRFKIHRLVIAVFLLPLISFAQADNITCSKIGYTIETVNGIFTNEGGPDELDGAIGNRNSLKREMDNIVVFKDEPITFDYLYNPTHGKIIDLFDVAIQKTFKEVDMQDPDFLKMLNGASTQVKTQKLLLVAHSQGNFYANNFYETVTRNGDVSEKSIGVYGVASPAGFVAGSGKYLTSNTDTVINLVRKNLPGTVLPANDRIDYLETDDSGNGHGFREIYLNYRGDEIKKGIEESLARLSVAPNRSENIPCINPPEIVSVTEKITHVASYSAKLTVAVTATAVTARNNAITDEAIRKFQSTMFAVLNTYNTTVATAVWTYNTTVAAAVWGYNTTVAVVNTVGHVAGTVTSNIYDGAKSLFGGAGNLVGSNSASVILATKAGPSTPTVNKKSVVTPVANHIKIIATSAAQPPALTPPDPVINEKLSAPKLVFVGMPANVDNFSGFGGGMPAKTTPQEVLSEQAVVPKADEAVITTEEVVSVATNAGAAVGPAAI